ncbi:MAG: hypothetical protein ACT4NL_05740 [Pseudomarimonas sp.]
MRRIIAVLLVALSLGSLIANAAGAWPIQPGVVGAALMVVAALAVRRRWGVLAEAAPGSPERALWIGLFGNGVVAAHLAVTLWHIGPNMVMHTPQIHALGVDNWTLVAGWAVSYWIARDPQPRSDERDQVIAASGMRAAYYGLLALLIAQILALGFVRDGWVAEMSHPSIAHGLILAIIGSCLTDAISRLRAYAADADANAFGASP